MLAEELLKVITQERERQFAEAQRVRSAISARSYAASRPRWLRDLGEPAPTFGGRPHPGRAAAEPTL